MSTQPGSMSLTEVIGRYGHAYLMTTNARGAPHAVVVFPLLQDGIVRVNGVGRRTRENATARPAVGLLWPPHDPADHSLIVDGDAIMNEDQMRIAPTRAVLHRSLPAPHATEPGACISDCVELALPSR